MEAFREIYPQTFLTRHLEHGVRPDGRMLGEMRATQMAVNNLGSEATVGSSFVKQGGTTIVAGVKAELVSRGPCLAEDGAASNVGGPMQKTHIFSHSFFPCRREPTWLIWNVTWNCRLFRVAIGPDCRARGLCI